MWLEKFNLPKTDRRLIIIDNTVFKIILQLAIQPGKTIDSYEEFFSNPEHQDDIEKIITVLLTSEKNLQPIKTNNLTIFPYRKKWEIAHEFEGLYKNKKRLEISPNEHLFYIKPSEALSKTHKNCHKPASQCRNDHESNKQTSSHTKQRNSSGNNQISTRTCHREENMGIDKTNNTHPAKSCTSTKGIIDVVLESSMDGEPESEILHEMQLSTEIYSSPESEKLRQWLIASSSEEETPPCKEDDCENGKSYKPELVPAASTISSQTRKRHGEILNESEPWKKSYSVTEYLDTNRHDVQEQDLQEQLRFQDLATPTEEKPVVEKQSSLAQAIRSVKRLMFG